jgi:hypothetical protein
VGLNQRPLRWEEQGILTLDLAKQSGLKDRRHKTKTGSGGHTDWDRSAQTQVQEVTRAGTRGHINTGTTGLKDGHKRTHRHAP